MSLNNKHKISEKELDNLLGQAFLNLDFNNPKNEELMETISNQYLRPKSITFSFKGLILNKLIIGITCLVIVLGLGIYFYPNTNAVIKSEIQKNVSETKKAIVKSVAEPAENEKAVVKQNNVSSVMPEDQTPEVENINSNAGTIYLIDNNPVLENNAKPTLNAINLIVSNEDTGYVYPVLTEKEIKDNHKRKREMVKNLAELSKKIYLPVPKGTFDYNGQKVSVNGFYVETTEVSNLEYLTFVFDLLIQNRKEDFFKAKPDQKQWVKVFEGTYDFTNLKDAYFSDKTYRDYPVVNISREGAEMYCKWLTNATNEYLASKNKPLMNDLRIPTNHEWTYAARSGTNTADFPWLTNVPQNKLGCFLANFKIKNFGEVKRDPKAKCGYGFPNAITTAGTILGEMQTTVMIAAYNPNDFGLYCMSGNVAEMVYEQDLITKKISHGTRGGSWYSDLDYLRLTSENEFKNETNPSPMIGFRPVCSINKTHSFGSVERDNAEAGFPKLTSEEVTIASKEKKKMIEMLVKSNKDKYVQIPMGSSIYMGDTISVQSFYMETTEVTNLEYRTFLADLLIQDRNNDYLMAKPTQQAWMTKFPYSYNEPMTNMYFWHPAYDEYPVVNISRKGAQLYCEWLTIEANKILKENNKPLINDLRIPTDLEWAYAASNGKNQVRYANGNTFLRDSKGKYEVNYMCYSKDQCRYDSAMKLYVPKKEIVGLKDKNDNPGFVADGAFHTSLAKAYNANTYGLYGMAGNVSEMVNTYDKKAKKYLNTGTKGGSWFSCDYFLEIDADDEFPGEIEASPLIGFRPVFTAPKNIK